MTENFTCQWPFIRTVGVLNSNSSSRSSNFSNNWSTLYNRRFFYLSKGQKSLINYYSLQSKIWELTDSSETKQNSFDTVANDEAQNYFQKPACTACRYQQYSYLIAVCKEMQISRSNSILSKTRGQGEKGVGWKFESNRSPVAPRATSIGSR